MMKAIYLNGERFGSVVQALAYLEKRWGKRTDYGTLRQLADRDGILTAEGKRQIRVSWKAAGGETAEEWEGEEDEAEEAGRAFIFAFNSSSI